MVVITATIEAKDLINKVEELLGYRPHESITPCYSPELLSVGGKYLAVCIYKNTRTWVIGILRGVRHSIEDGILVSEMEFQTCPEWSKHDMYSIRHSIKTSVFDVVWAAIPVLIAPEMKVPFTVKREEIEG